MSFTTNRHTAPRALRPWAGPSAEHDDICTKVLAHGLLAINPHNIQPWKVRLVSKNEFFLYVDPERVFVDGDPFYRQVHIGQGTFLENVDLAAREYGHAARIDYFPEGMYGNTTLENKPVARVRLVEDAHVERDPLYEHIFRRQTNRRVYLPRDIAPPLLTTLLHACAESSKSSVMRIASLREDVMPIADVLKEAIALYNKDADTYADTVRMVRFDDAEVERFRDGLAADAAGLTGIAKFIKERLIKRANSLRTDSRFAGIATRAGERMVDSARAFGWVTGRNDRLSQVLVGRDYQRISLMCAQFGLAKQPVGEILIEKPFMARTHERLRQLLKLSSNDTVHVIFRLGYATPVRVAPRRDVFDLIAD
jgi:hypothetical protein